MVKGCAYNFNHLAVTRNKYGTRNYGCAPI